MKNKVANFTSAVLLIFTILSSSSALAVPLLISISNPPAAVDASAVGDTQFWPNAGTLGVGGTPISLRATVQSISAGDTIRFFTSGDNPVVRANTGTLSATVLWEVFDQATGLPISGDPDFLITDIDGNGGNPIESVSAACAGLTSYTVNGAYLDGCDANTNTMCESNIRVSESGGSILAEGTQNQNAGQQEGYMQYSWTDVSSWTVSYFATTGGRWYVHDADGDIPFDGTRVDINLVDLATIKGVTSGSLTSPAQGEEITFQIDLSNAGPAPATGANLTDLLPAGLSYLSHTASAGTYNPGNGNWTGVNVAVNDTETLTITAEVTAAAGTTITNTTTTALAAESVCSARDLLEYSFVVAETPDPSMTIVKSVDPITSFSAAGDTITYSYLVTNTGNVNIDNVVPTDTGPTFGGQPATNMLSSFSPTSATITPGNNQVFTATYILEQADIDNMAQDANPLTGIDNSASAMGTPTGGMLPVVPASMVETGFAPIPSLSVVKSVSSATSFSQAGDTITYQYVVTNTGNITIDSVAPTDAGPTFNGAPATNTLSGFSPASVSLAPMASQTFNATYLLDQIDVDNMAASGTPLTAIDNTASATGDPVGATALPTTPDSTAETGFAPAPGLSIAKSVSTATSFSQAGDTITYEYNVQNTGNVTVNNVVPTDTGPTFNGVAAVNTLSAFSPTSVSLAPMSSQLFTATYILDQADVDNMFAASDPLTAIDNSAAAQGVPIGGVLPAVTPSLAETGFAASASLSLTKTAGTPSVGLGLNTSATDAGDTIAYSFAVTNNGTVTIDNIAINDLGVTFNSVAGTGSLSAINCPTTTLAPNQSTTCTALYTLSQADVDNAIIGGSNAVTNMANASGQDPANTTVATGNETADTTIAADSGIELTKSAAAPTVAAGNDATIVDPDDTITFSVVVENTGNTTLSNVDISDSITSLTCPATTNLGNPFANSGADTLAVGDGITCTAVYTLMQTDLDAGEVSNTASVTSQDPTGANQNDSDTVVSGFTQKAAISLVKSGTELPANPMEGDLITYSFNLTNTGNVSLSAPQVSDAKCQTPLGPLTFSNGYVSGDGLVAGEMEVGETWLFQCQYAITQPDINLGEITNTATGTGTPPIGSGLTPPSSMASNLAEAQQNAAISLVKTASLPTVSGGSLATATDVGDTVSYSFEVENTGNVTLSNVMVSDPLITDPPNNGTINCGAGLASMAPGDVVTCTAEYTLTLTEVNAGQAANTANATGTPPVTIPPTDAPTAESSSVVNIIAAPALMVEKSVQALPTPFAENSIITYSYEVTNSGNVSITSVSPVDAGPTFNGISGTNSLSAFSPLTADLDPGDSEIFTATYAVSQTDLDNLASASDPLTAIDNTATAQGTPSGGASLSPVEPSTVETGIQLVPEISLTKSSTAPNPALVGSDIVYSFALQNTGVLSISNPQVSDSQCAMPGTVLNFASGYQSGDIGATPTVLDPGETWMFSCTYPIQQSDIDAGTVQNTAVGSGQDPSGDTVEDTSDSTNPGDAGTGDDDPTNTPLVRTPSWTVDKTTTSVPTKVNDTLVYRFEVDNTGNVSISSVLVNDAKCAAAPTLISGDTNGDDVLDPIEMWTFECTSVPVTQTEVNAGTVNNSVSVTGTPPAGSPVLPPATDSEMTPITPAPDLSVAKTADAPTVGLGDLASATDAGDTISYSFVVQNTGNVTIDSLVVNDSGPSFGGTPGVGIWSGVSCPVTILLPDQSTTCTAIYTLDQADIDLAIANGSDSVANTATAGGNPPVGGGITSAPSDATQTIASNPSLVILKTAGEPTTTGGTDSVLTDPGDTIEFTITVENTGNTTLSNVLVSDNLATVSCAATAAPSGSSFVNDGSGSLAVGDTASCTATYTIEQDDINLGQVVNTGSVVSEDPSGTPVTGVDEATSSFTQKTSVALQKTSNTLPPVPVAGVSVITYSFNLTNTGNVSLSDAQVSDAKCEAPLTPLTFASGYVSGDSNNNGALDAAETWLFQCDYVVTQADINLGEISNVATGTGTPPAGTGLDAPSATSSNLAEAGQFTGITLDKVAGVPTQANGENSQVGDTITFTFNIENTGNVSLTDIDLNDPLITEAPNSGTISCVRDDVLMTPFDPTVDTLNPNEQLICTGDYVLVQEDIDAGTVSNVANIEATPPPSVPPIDKPTATSGSMTPVLPDPKMSIDKTASVIPVDVMAGTVITYSYEVVNTGNVSLSVVSPTDLGPTFNGVAGTNTLSAFSPAPVNLAPTESQTFTATYVISQTDLDNMAASATPATAIANEASAEAEPANGPNPEVTPDTVLTGVAPDPEMELTKSSTVPSPLFAGSLITYTFNLENTGNVTISNPIINDAKCELPSAPLSFNAGYQSGDSGVIAESLDVGETWIFSCQYAVTQADIDAGTVQNTANAVGQDPAGNDVMDDSDSANAGDDTGGDSDPTNTPLTRNPLWSVEKSTASTPMNLGDTLQYQFVITNDGNVSISVTDVSDAKCQAPPVLVSATDAGSDGLISPAGAGGVPAAEQWTYTCTSLPMVQADLDAGQTDNTVTIMGTAPGGNPAEATDTVSTPINTMPAMSLVKSAGAATLNADGSFNQVFNFVLKNTGNVTLNTVSINDDIGAQFGSCVDGVLSSGVATLVDVAPLSDSVAPISGSAPVVAASAGLGVGDSIAVNNYIVRFNPNASGCTFPSPAANTATANASTTAAGNVSDVSDSGTDPDAGNSNDSGDPTPFTPPTYSPQLGSSKSAGAPTLNADGTIDVEYTLLVQNTGNVDIQNLSLNDDLVSQFGSAFSASPASNSTGGIIVAPEVTEVLDANAINLVVPNASIGYDGSGASNMLDGSSGYLGVGDRISITFTTRINPNATGAPSDLLNTATASGTDPSGVSTSDDTDSGTDPTVNPGGPGTPTSVVPPISMPALELVKNGTINSNGSIDYEFVVTNTGNVNVMDIAITDPLISTFVYSLSIDADIDNDIDFLAPGASALVTANYVLTPADIAAGRVENTANAMGVDSTGMNVADDSDSGNLADDTGAGDDPTVTVFDAPRIGVAKAVKAGSPVDLGNGTYQMTYEFVVQNNGQFDLSNVQVTDDLNAMINNPNPNGGTFSSALVTSPNNTLTPNSSYNGSTNTNMLSGADALLVGESGLLELTFIFDPAVYFGPFFNQATASANDHNGDVIEDLSEQGSVVNQESESVTPFSISTPSTPITLGWFYAEAQGGLTVFNWATEVEVSNAGFYLSYKSEEGDWLQVNDEMIPAKGDATNVQEYQYTAAGLYATQFKLTDVSVTGKRVEHGPFEINVEHGVKSQRKDTNWDAIQHESERKRIERQQELRDQLQIKMKQFKLSENQIEEPSDSNGQKLKRSAWSQFAGTLLSLIVPAAHALDLASFEVENAGLYKVTHSELSAKGVDLRGMPVNRIGIEQANLPWPIKVYPVGEEVFSEQSYIVFPGQGLRTLYSGTNKYTLVLDEGGVSTIQDDASPVPENTAPAPSYLAERSYAPQNRYTHISPSANDSWYADRLMALNSSVSKDVTLTIDDYSPALNTASFGNSVIARMPNPRPKLRVNLWGGSNLPGNGLTEPDHHVLVEFNGTVVADESFDGLHEYPIETTLSNLRHGQNVVSVELPKDHGYQFDLVNLDSVTIQYPRLFKAENSGKNLSFASAWGFFKVSELKSEVVTVVRVDENRNGHLMLARAKGACSDGCVYFAGSMDGGDNAYYVATNDGFMTPKIELVDSAIDLFDGPAEYLIIAHPDFIASSGYSLETYANQLSNDYSSVDVVDVEAIYGQYSGHVMDANAIYSYIQDAYFERGTRHVLLVGGDNYDYHDNLNKGGQSYIPSLYVSIATNVNAVPSDAKYADIDDDFIPDITISRLPVRSDQELRNIFAKRQSYLTRSATRKAIFAADKVDNSGYSFKSDSDDAINQHFSDWNVSTVYSDDLSVAEGKQQLLEGINSGASLISYYGHSSTDRWTISGLFTGEDAGGLTNYANPAVVTQWGCWNTFYVSPEQDSLAHRLLVDGEHGAVTVMGASSFTKAGAERKMASLLFERLNQGMKIGDAVLSAKRALAQDNPYQLDVLLGWTVLGLDDFAINGE